MLTAGKDIKQEQIAGQGRWIVSGVVAASVLPQQTGYNVSAALSLSAFIKLLLASFLEKEILGKAEALKRHSI